MPESVTETILRLETEKKDFETRLQSTTKPEEIEFYRDRIHEIQTTITRESSHNLQTLKLGDCVFYDTSIHYLGRLVKCTVTKITPKQIEVQTDENQTKKFWITDCSEVGSSKSLDQTHCYLPNDTDFTNYEIQRLYEKWTFIANKSQTHSPITPENITRFHELIDPFYTYLKTLTLEKKK